MKDPTSAHENSTVMGSCVAAVVPYALNLVVLRRAQKLD